jgi:arylsulfatase A-like enzyme
MRRCLFLALILVLPLGFASPTRREPPNVLLIVVDTLRADRLGAYGNGRDLTPFLDSLARRGTVFANAYAPSSWTCPSVASLFTSRYASQHGVVRFDSKLSESEVTLAERLIDVGYLSGGFSANFRLAAEYGYAQGFANWTAYLPRDGGDPKPDGGVLRKGVTHWLTTLGTGSRSPVLLYLQYMEPHAPYVPPEPYRTKFGLPSDATADEHAANAKLTALGGGDKGLTPSEIALLASLYDSEVAAVDAEISALFSELDRLGFLRDAVVIVTADHGEEFGEHGEFLHGLTLYNPSVRVPLIIAGPGIASGQTVSENVSLIDVAPTLLDLAGLPPEPAFEGHSLTPLMCGSRARPTSSGREGAMTGQVISELERSHLQGYDVRRHARAIFDGPQKLILDPRGRTMLYDLSTDPGETTPLKDPASVARTSELLARLARRQPSASSHATTAAAGPVLDDATKEKLRALGYQL